MKALQLYGPTCWWCWAPIDLSLDRQRHPMGLTVDHWNARANGGDKYSLDNLRPMHRSCNSSKGKRTVPGTRRISMQW